MNIDPKQHLVLIRGEDKTEEIFKVSRGYGRTVVTFKNGKSYLYAPQNVKWISDPERISTLNRIFSIGGKPLAEVEDVLRFDPWVKIFLAAGGSKCFPFALLTSQELYLPDGRSTDVLAYFRELAEGAPLRTGEDDSLLGMKYRHLDSTSPGSILWGFLQTRPSDSWPISVEPASLLIFPFGCNMSQKEAVRAALENPVSLIQGPPGTGKTQTILNLIAKLLLQDKRIAVVSNNNSATANVLEKLEKNALDFMTAFLGNAENKTMFIAGQKDTAMWMPTFQEGEEAPVREEIFRLNNELDAAFKAKNELAALIQKIDALRLESAHHEKFLEEAEGRDSEVRNVQFGPEISARQLMDYWLACERIAMFHESWKITAASDGFDSPAFKKALRVCLDLLGKIRLLIRFGLAARVLFKLRLREYIPILRRAYYHRKIEELNGARKSIEVSLEGFRFDERLERLTSLSMQLFKHHLAGRYNNRKRKRFSHDDLWRRPEEFLEEYPVVLSTTFSLITSVKSGYLFDCVIVDEASQVDLLNGVLAMGCAEKLVIVGDPMQLPNVLTKQDEGRAERVASKYSVPDHARFERHSLLSAVGAAFPGIPKTMLREHYRCHPKIIGFCNLKFYGGELLAMTVDKGEPDVLKVCITVEGRHARENFNQRQIDEIVLNVLPDLGLVKQSDIGIVSPYRMQVARMRPSVGSDEIEIDTVHKFQGREKRAIIITTVSNETNEFVDNPNLLNVAISRAQEKLRLVVSKEMAEGGGNIAEFVRYIRYKNCEVVPGKVRSIFDLLYQEYTEARHELLGRRKRISKYDSENLAHMEIESILKERIYLGYGVVSQFPLSMLVRDAGRFTAEESSYAAHPWTRTDFLIYRKTDKIPMLVVEIDGYSFHRKKTRQAERDALKDSVLMKCGVPILRLSTVGSNERSLIKRKLEEVVGIRSGP